MALALTGSSQSFTFSLSSILKKRNLSPSKLDEIKVKYNIIGSFLNEKVEEAKAKAEEAKAKAEEAREKVEL